MRFTCERDTIVDALSFVSKYAGDGKGIPIIGNVLIDAGESVRVSTTDTDRAASDQFAAEVSKPGSVCLPAQLLLRSIKGSSGAEVTVDADERQAAVTVGRSRFKLPVLPAAAFPKSLMLSTPAPHNFTMPGELIASLEKQVTFAHEPEGGRYYLVGTSWKSVGGKLEFCATDGKRMAVAKSDVAAEIPATIVPIFAIPQWKGDVSVSLSDMFIRFQSGSQTVASKLLEGSYPDYERVIPSNANVILIDRDELLASVNRASLIADRGEHSIMIVGRDGTATVSAISANGEVNDEISYDGPDFQCAHTHSVLISALSSFDCEIIELRWGDHVTGLTMHIPNHDDRVCMVQPYRDARLSGFIPTYREAAE